MSRRYISIAEAAEYLGISTKTVRRPISAGEIKGYRIGRYTGKLIRVDLNEIDDKLMNPVGPYWNDDSARPRKRESKPIADRSAAVTRIDPLDRTYYRFCKCGHPRRDHGDYVNHDGPCTAPTWINIPGQLSQSTGPCKCKQFDEETRRRRRIPKSRLRE